MFIDIHSVYRYNIEDLIEVRRKIVFLLRRWNHETYIPTK